MIADQLYSLLLRAYPAEFRRAFGGEMLLLFRDQWRDRWKAEPNARRTKVGHARTTMQFWAAILLDVGRSAPPLRLRALWSRVHAPTGQRWTHSPDLQPEDRIMTRTQIVAALAVLGGVFEVLSTASEASDGWSMNHGNGWLLAISLGVLMGTLLLVSGAGLLRRGASATRLAQGTALGCLALVIAMHFIFPYMSIFSLLVGIALPIAVLVVASQRSRDRTPHSIA